MGNVITVFARALRSSTRIDPDINDADLPVFSLIHNLAVLLDGQRSYNVPLFADDVPGGGDYQYGHKWSMGGGPEMLWELANGHLDPIWVRHCDEGADYDMIVRIGVDGKAGNIRPCRYGFDAVRFLPDRELPHDLRVEAELDEDDWWCMDLEGSYFSHNSRSTLGSDLGQNERETWYRTLTTPTNLQYVGPGEIHPPETAEMVEKIIANADAAQFFWKGRKVTGFHVINSGPHETEAWSNDDYWDNCRDSEYRKSMGEEPDPADAARDRADWIKDLQNRARWRTTEVIRDRWKGVFQR
jgi:hypothetical protein